VNAKKRKDSCTFKRENSLRVDSLDKQERTYSLLPTSFPKLLGHPKQR
jgi:hypothetical protein